MRKLGLLIVLFLVSVSFGATPVMAFNPKPEPPIDLILGKTIELRGLVEDADTGLFRGALLTYAERLQSALVSKINEVIVKFEMEDWYGGYHKLNNDIKPKLWNPYSEDFHKKSWLNPQYDGVLTFVAGFQGIIEEINLSIATTGCKVRCVPSVIPIGGLVMIRCSCINYEPTTVMVQWIALSIYRGEELLDVYTLDHDSLGWQTDCVLPGEERLIYSWGWHIYEAGDWYVEAGFFSSAGVFYGTAAFTVQP